MPERDEGFFEDEPDPSAEEGEVEPTPAPKPKKKKRAKKAKGRVEYDPEAEQDAMYKRHMQSRGMMGPYPTEEPDDPTVLWSPSPGIYGSKKLGYKKIK